MPFKLKVCLSLPLAQQLGRYDWELRAASCSVDLAPHGDFNIVG